MIIDGVDFWSRIGWPPTYLLVAALVGVSERVANVATAGHRWWQEFDASFVFRLYLILLGVFCLERAANVSQVFLASDSWWFGIPWWAWGYVGLLVYRRKYLILQSMPRRVKTDIAAATLFCIIAVLAYYSNQPPAIAVVVVCGALYAAWVEWKITRATYRNELNRSWRPEKAGEIALTNILHVLPALVMAALLAFHGTSSVSGVPPADRGLIEEARTQIWCLVIVCILLIDLLRFSQYILPASWARGGVRTKAVRVCFPVSRLVMILAFLLFVAGIPLEFKGLYVIVAVACELGFLWAYFLPTISVARKGLNKHLSVFRGVSEVVVFGATVYALAIYA